MTKSIMKSCFNCGKIMHIPPCYLNRYTYCSPKCKDEATHVNLVCLNCGKSFRTHLSSFQKGIRCCSLKCKYERTKILNKTVRSKEELKRLYNHPPVPTPEVRLILSETKKGDRNPMKKPEVARKVSRTLKQRYVSQPDFSNGFKKIWREDRNRALKWGKLPKLKQRPNGSELKIIKIIDDENLPFDYVGNSTFWIGPCISGKCRNPDFIHKNHVLKRAILFNARHWHPPNKEIEEITDYKGKGYDVLVVHEEELKDKIELADRIASFVGG